MSNAENIIPQWTQADRFAKARHVAGLSQEELAERLDLSLRTIRRYEAGMTPKRTIIVSWAGAKIARHLRACGVDATAHQLRHTFGTEAARASNGNLLVVADMMGHASLTTTATYTKLVGVSTAATVAAMYPAA